MPHFDNQFLRLLPGDPVIAPGTRQVRGALWSSVATSPVSDPKMLHSAPQVLALLGLTPAEIKAPLWSEALAGNGLVPGMQSYATCYGGHQFGNWAGQLGDGRAIYLGERVNAAGARYELQLKGAGPTPYSRHADGRAVLRSSIREYLCSEAMHYLGAPTTRALSLMSTGESVLRDMFYDGNPELEPGAIVCRVAPSFTRFGHFELPASRGETDLLKRLVAFTIARDFPHIESDGAVAESESRALWFKEVCTRTAMMVAHWMRVGFVHGVMNTDNMSILGLTIDYGPYGWMDNYDPRWTPNTTDLPGRRYCFGNQPQIARWNLGCLASALSTLGETHDWLHDGIRAFDETFARSHHEMLMGKFGLSVKRDALDAPLFDDAFAMLAESEMDMTHFFRALARVDPTAPDASVFDDVFYFETQQLQRRDRLVSWLQSYGARRAHESLPAAQISTEMNRVNPHFVLRNYISQQVIDASTAGDHSLLNRVFAALQSPYLVASENLDLCEKRPEWARDRAGCSTLSCSS